MISTPYENTIDLLNAKIKNIQDLIGYFNRGNLQKKHLLTNTEWLEGFINTYVKNNDIDTDTIFDILNFTLDRNNTDIPQKVLVQFSQALIDKAEDSILFVFDQSICNTNGPLCDLCDKVPIRLQLLSLIFWLRPDYVQSKRIKSYHNDSELIDLDREKILNTNITVSHDILRITMSRYSEALSEYNLSNRDCTCITHEDHSSIIGMHKMNTGNKTYERFYKEPKCVFLNAIYKNTAMTEDNTSTIAGTKVCKEVYNTLISLYRSNRPLIIRNGFENVENSEYLISDLIYIFETKGLDIEEDIKELRNQYSYIDTPTFTKIFSKTAVSCRYCMDCNDVIDIGGLIKFIESIQITSDNTNLNHYSNDIKDPDKEIDEAFKMIDTICLESVVEMNERKPLKITLGRDVATEASSTDKSIAKADKRIAQSSKIHEMQNKAYKHYKIYKTNEQKIDSQLTKIIRSLKNKVFNTDPEKARDQVIEGNKWTALTVLKKVLAGAAIFSTSKIGAILLIITRIFAGKRTKAAEKKKVLVELQQELEIVNEKINDANADGDKKAKYELMRTKHSIEATISKIATSYKSASDKNLANANAVIKSSRGVD